MAFIGAFFVTILMGIFGIFIWIAVALIICAILFIFIPCLIIAIINLVKGIKHHWPKRNIIPLAITGPISMLFILAFIAFLILALCVYLMNPTDAGSISSQIASSLLLLLGL
jgi:heme exporter protein D